MHVRTLLLLIALTAAGLLLIDSASAQRSEPKRTEIQGHDMVQVLKPGDIPAIYDPSFIPVEAADSLFYDDEPLLVYVAEDGARGYSTWQLDRHEIVNDETPRGPIAATW